MATANKTSEKAAETLTGSVKLKVINGRVIHDGKEYVAGMDGKDELTLPAKDAQRLLTVGVVKKA
ncbi:hypothetical protein [Saezia sanguinis]|uniref:hypothetical protein n=1 Tax=Saezia sanguinis TaxID=1965230 RepID=UPI003051B1AF